MNYDISFHCPIVVVFQSFNSMNQLIIQIVLKYFVNIIEFRIR